MSKSKQIYAISTVALVAAFFLAVGQASASSNSYSSSNGNSSSSSNSTSKSSSSSSSNSSSKSISSSSSNSSSKSISSGSSTSSSKSVSSNCNKVKSDVDVHQETHVNVDVDTNKHVDEQAHETVIVKEHESDHGCDHDCGTKKIYKKEVVYKTVLQKVLPTTGPGLLGLVAIAIVAFVAAFGLSKLFKTRFAKQA